ncbi:MAG: leucine-rich repeat domain-containing protein [Clostridia bacterium]
MTKTRFKIVSTVVSMCLAVMVMGFAVWAASTQSLPVSNTIDFTSIHVLSTVTGTVTGAKAETFANYGPISTLAGDSEGKLGTWAIGSAMEFVDETQSITITLTIVNNSDERSLSFELSNQVYSAFNGTNLGNSNIDRTCVYSINNLTPITNETYVSGTIEVESLKTATIVMTLDISDNGKSVNSFDNSFSLTLRNMQPFEGYSFVTGDGEIESFSTTEPLTEENLPELSIEGQPAFYGLYTDETFTNKIEFPYSGTTAIYAKFGNPENLIFTAIANGEEYSVCQNGLLSGEVDIPEKYNWKSVTTLPNDAFRNSTALTKITIPYSVTTVGTNVLTGCSTLNTLSAPLKNSYIANTNSYLRYYFGGWSYLSGGTIPSTLFNVIIADGVTAIADNAFYNFIKVDSITFPDSLISFGNMIFSSCAGLDTFNIPKNLASFGAQVFKGAYSIDSIVVDEENTNFKVVDNILYNYAGTSLLKFLASRTDTEFTIPNEITYIGDCAFQYCSRLVTVIVPNTVTYLGVSAFGVCSGLINVNIPTGISTINDYTFQSCQKISNITIPSNVTSIKTSAFMTCTSLTEFTIPNSVTSIGNACFESCLGLTSITLSENLVSLGYQAFSGCSKLASITIPSSVTTLGDNVFMNCHVLKTVFLKSVTVAARLTTPESEGRLLYNFLTDSKLYILDWIKDSIGSYVSNLSNFSEPVYLIYNTYCCYEYTKL